MKTYPTESIRNVLLLGHGGSGKTTLSEVLAYDAGLIDRIGTVEEGGTISDFDQTEKQRGFSISSSIIPIEHNGKKINLIDVPGYFDFIGEAQGALRVADAAIVVIDAMAGVEVGTEKAVEMLKKAGIPYVIAINKMDKENVDYPKVLGEITELVGENAIPFEVPIGVGLNYKGIVDLIEQKQYEGDAKTAKASAATDEQMEEGSEYIETITERVAETSEELLEKYLEEMELPAEDIKTGVSEAILGQDIIPVINLSSTKNIGVENITDFIINYLPSPDKKGAEKAKNKSDEEVEVEVDSNGPFSAYVFKTVADPYVGKLSIFKVMSGTLTNDTDLYNTTQDSREKANHIYVLRGNHQDEVDKLEAGDIGAYSKLANTLTGDTLTDINNRIVFEATEMPKPVISTAIEAHSKSDVDKLSTGLHRLMEEDPTIGYDRNQETHQTLLSGLGEMHLDIISEKLKQKFGVDVDLLPLRIPYRETITSVAEAQGRHKKQSGGAGQFGDVWVKFEPCDDMNDEFTFVDAVVGGAVPRNFIPAVEKGLKEAMDSGVLAGYPVTGVKATLYDGSYHAVDSDEMSFKMAANLAYRNGMPQAKPILLEPIYSLRITVPEEYMGDIMGDLNKKRGRIMGMEPIDGGKQVINAEAPFAELFRYATELRSMTQARGDFSMEFVRYEQAPNSVSEKVIKESEK